jgi:1,4-beta-D-xylan synthase
LLPEAIRRRSDAYNAGEELRARRLQQEEAVAAGGALEMAPLAETVAVKATWMSDGSQWHGTWLTGAMDHARGDHAGIIQVIDQIPNYSSYLLSLPEILFILLSNQSIRSAHVSN